MKWWREFSKVMSGDEFETSDLRIARSTLVDFKISASLFPSPTLLLNY
jgi:hypothetical protein